MSDAGTDDDMAQAAAFANQAVANVANVAQANVVANPVPPANVPRHEQFQIPANQPTMFDAFRRCGFTNTGAKYLVDMGVRKVVLRDYTSPEFDALASNLRHYNPPNNWDLAANGLKVLYPHAMKRLKGFQRYLVFCRLRRENARATDFDGVLVDIWCKRHEDLYNESQETEAITVKQPEGIKKVRQWKEFDRRLRAYLSQIRGATSTYMVYLLRAHDEPTDEMLYHSYYETNNAPADYDSIDACMHDTVHFDTAQARRDDKQLFHLLQTLFLGGELEVHTKKFVNKGRKVYLAAKAMGTGEAARTTEVARANKLIRSLKYDGTKRNYSFDRHVNNFLEAYQDLSDNDNPVPADTQVTQFLASIDDKRLKSAIPTILSNEKYSSDIQECVSLLSSILAQQGEVQDGRGDTRRINAATSEKGKGKFKGKLEARKYSRDEWFSMDKTQQETVIRLRNEQKKRKASAAKSTPRESADSDDDDEDKAPADQFGRNGDKPKDKAAKKSKK